MGLFLLVLALLLSLLPGPAPAAPLAGAPVLGGSRDAFERAFGPPVHEQESGGYRNAVYDVAAFDAFAVAFDAGQAVGITIFSDRGGDVYEDDGGADAAGPARGDWTPSEALGVAKAFLPPDAACGAGRVADEHGNLAHGCRSAALADSVSAATLAALNVAGAPGDCLVVLAPTDAGAIWVITLLLGAGEPEGDAT